MPLYTAGSLRTRLAKADGPLPTNETMSNFHQLASALHYAHTRPRPVIHRDIKPENILLHQEDARLVITDFGIARWLEPGARVGKTITVRGTVGYMAPEQTSGVVDPRSDQYGCAVVLYEMLTGYHPLDPYGGAIPTPSALNPNLPKSLDSVVLRGLATRPEERYASMLEFVQTFDQAVRRGSGGSSAMRIPPVSPAPASAGTPSQVRGISNHSFPAVQTSSGKPDSSGRQQAVKRPSTTGSVREKCLEGDELRKQRRYTQALAAYEEALRMDPRNFYAWNGKGTTLYNQGSYKKALEAYQRATEIDPENAVDRLPAPFCS